MIQSMFRPKTASMSFYGYILLNERYNNDGSKNNLFKINKQKFEYEILDSRNIDKEQTINNMVFLTQEMFIKTKTQSDRFIKGNYLELDGVLYVIMQSNQDPGSTRHVYRNFSLNQSAYYTMLVKEAQE